MTEDNQGASGNRWEPTEPPTTDTASQADADPAPPTSQVPVAAAAKPTERRPWLSRARTAVAGGAAAVLLVGGLGGFAIGRATAGTGDDLGRTGQQGVPTGFDREGDGGFTGGQDGQGQGGPGGPMLGQQPDGQVPGMPGQGDGQDDGQDGGQDGQSGSQQDDTDGTGSSNT
jgi:hypothetical protein